ncbi:hypothetical protein H5410_014715 [Solanum commersonii]|uniref:Uncharacterized protein n=1 Tax=Solanum commersonii TaxID=4109 RepID=A0A9J5ZS09_SOLCO|nr:hypothetical protein H5410_014715 [Solanum commersonii]
MFQKIKRNDNWLRMCSVVKIMENSFMNILLCMKGVSNSFDFYDMDIAYVMRQHLDQSLRATDDVGRPRPTSTYECEQFTEGSGPRPTGDVCRITGDLWRNASKSADRCVQATDNSGSPRPTSADKVVPRPTSADRCVHATNYAARPCPMPTYRCVQATDDAVMARLAVAKGDVGRPRRTSANTVVCRPRKIRGRGDAGRHWYIVTAVGGAICGCTYHIGSSRPCDVARPMRIPADDECRPWLLPHVVGRRRLLNAHIPRQMCAGIGCQMRSCHIRCVYALVVALPLANADVAQPIARPRLIASKALAMSLPLTDACSRCRLADRAAATDDASRLWLMVYVIGRRHLPNAHTPQLMLAGLGKCRLSLADAHAPLSVTLYHCAYATSDSCRPWLMLHAVGQRCLPDAHTP